MNDAATNQSVASQDGTRDVFLSYNSRDREAVMRVWKLLEARAVSTFLDRKDLTPGLPWQVELEAALAKVNAVAVFIGSEGIGAWQRPEKELALNRQQIAQHAGQRFPVIPVLLPDADANKVTGFLSLNTWIDLRNGLDHPATAAGIDALARAVKGEQLAAQTPQPEPLCPYRGLEPFHEDDAALFFGRDEFAEALMQKVLAQPLVAVVGPSGSGKSSVVQAGLLPRLRRACWPQQTWEAIVFTPREQPFHSLAKELLLLYEPTLDKTERMMAARKLGEALAAGEIPLDDPIAEALKAIAKGMKTDESANRLLLVVDQFEELFTLSEERQRQPFVEALIAAATRADSPLTVVLTLRADFYGQAIGLSRTLSDGIQQGLVNLGPMTKDELWQAIVKPAKSVGLRFEPELVERLLINVMDQPGSLPLLEFALKELWLRRRNGMIVNEQYDEIGKLEGAISKRADAQFERVPPAEREAVLRAFTRLVRVSAANEEGTDTRQRVRLKDLDAAVHPVVKSFVKERLLVMSRDEETNEETVEVAHEALIRRWERLKELLNKDRQFFLWRQRLGLMLGEWQRTGRDAGALLQGVRLNEARRWRKERGQALNEREQEFITRSESAERRPKYWIAAAVVLVIASALAAGGWWLWDKSAESQINKILSKSPDVIKLAQASTSQLILSTFIKDWIRSLVLVDRKKEALHAVRKIENANFRALALVEVVEALAKAGKSEEALDIARKIEDANFRALALVGVVEALTKAGKSEEAKSVAKEALDAARKIEDAYSLALTLVEVVEALAKAGKSEEALDAARKIEDAEFRVQALSNVIGLLAKAGQTEEAFDATHNIKDADTLANALIGVVDALAKAGQTVEVKSVADKALDTVRKSKNAEFRAWSLSYISGALAKAGQTEEAKSVASEAFDEARKIENPGDRAQALGGIVEMLAKAGISEKALDAAHKIEDAYFRVLALVNVAEVFSNGREVNKAKDAIEEAQRVAQQVTKEIDRSKALANVATGLARLHFYRQARELVDNNNTSAADKLTAYAAILREYHLKDHPEDAKLFEMVLEQEN
jgi:tetratricopeptide (TPR) repeat protein